MALRMQEGMIGSVDFVWKISLGYEEEIVSDKDIDEMQRDCPVVQKLKKMYVKDVCKDVFMLLNG